MGRSKRARHVCGWAILVLFTCTGCDLPAVFFDALPTSSEPGRQATLPEESVEVPDGPPEELAKRLEESLREATETARLLNGSPTNQQLRIAKLIRVVHTGVAVAEKVVQSAEADDQQRHTARQGKLVLLCLGAKHDPKNVLPRLEEYVAALRNEQHRSLAAIGDAAIIEVTHLAANKPDENTLPSLVEYAKTYPECGAGIVLFQQHGAQLESANRLDEAKQCYRTAVQLYGHLAESKTVRDRLDRLVQRERTAVNRRQAKEKQLEQICRKLGNREDGYFVIYAYEVNPPSDKMFELYSFKYEVLRGRDAAAMYIAGLKPNWEWELVRRFPDTPAAYSKATELAKEETKKRAFISY